MGRTFRLAIGQSPAHLSTGEERLYWLSGELPAIAEKKADLLLLPELFASGYHIGEEIKARAEASNGPTARAISKLAATYGVAIHYGYPERDGDLLYNSAQCFGPDGKLLGTHRKLLIPPGFERDFFTPGNKAHLFTYRDVQIATLICYDVEFPEAVRHVASLGAELVLAPTALGAQWEWVSQRMIPARAYENGIFLAYANSAGVEEGMTFLGQSFVAGPDGEELVRASANPEIIHVSLNLEKVTAALSSPIFQSHYFSISLVRFQGLADAY